jgi:hypothetical protein
MGNLFWGIVSLLTGLLGIIFNEKMMELRKILSLYISQINDQESA